jgi:hypothetical protein
MVREARALEQMLLLTRGILCSNLLAIDALHGQAFVVFCKQVSVGDTEDAIPAKWAWW